MPKVSRRQLDTLSPYLEGEEANEDGEWGMHCPLHDDSKRSASLNIYSGLWYCQACELGGKVKDLIDRIPVGGVEHNDSPKNKERSSNGDGKYLDPSNAGNYHRALLSDDDALLAIIERRGLEYETLARYRIGWDSNQNAYTIPIFNGSGGLVNIRRYQLDPPGGRRKIWSVKGHGTPTLYPIEQLEENEIIICEGEWDALMTIQNGFAAVTRTGAADVWKDSWNGLFDGKVVRLCHDMDTKGQKANKKLMRALEEHAKEISIITLPYEITDKHGKDLSDYWLEGHTPLDLLSLYQEPEDSLPPEESDVTVLDSFDSSQAGKKLRLRVTITGKHNPPFLVPHEISYHCTQDAGSKCLICPMNEMNGSADRAIKESDPIILEMMGASNKQVTDILRQKINAQKCNVLEIDVTQYRSIEELYARPSVDKAVTKMDAGDYTNRKIISVGRHDTMPNSTVEMVGSIHPAPKGQRNELMAWDVHKTETTIDRFEVDSDTVKLLKNFQTRGRPLKKIGDIARDLARHVTKIYGRNEMHALMDLVLHSALGFHFGGSYVERGWLEGLVVGDTRTGKSEVARKLVHHYRVGEMISCESATFAGIVGGLQQLGNKEWEVTWGSIPLNDRRAVILDEVSGLTTEQIGQMSSIRSSGIAELTKIRSERTFARTRLVWLGNPRSGRLSDYTYGVQAVSPLIGNSEDVARFDLAMSVAASEVDTAEINRMHLEDQPQKYTSEMCEAMVLWAWSRQPDQVVWATGAQDAVYGAAIALGDRYVETPPLVQAANARIKVARVAVAMAARTFSTDKSNENILVEKRHVNDAVRFMDIIYNMHGFGYAEISREAIEDRKIAIENYDEAKSYVVQHPGLSKFLRAQRGVFRRQDLEDMMNLDRSEANGMINTLWKYRMVERQGPDVKIKPMLHQMLREVRV